MVGRSEVRVGSGLLGEIVNVSEFDVVPDGPCGRMRDGPPSGTVDVKTFTVAVPAAAISAAVMAAVNEVALIKVVVRLVPFH